MKATHKSFGEIKITGQNENKVYITLSDGSTKEVLRLFAANMITNVDGSAISFENIPNVEEVKLPSIGAVAKKSEGKLAAMMANAHEDEKYNPMTKNWEKI